MNKRFTPLKVSAPVRTCPQPSTEETRRDKKRGELREGLNGHVDSPSLAVVHRQVWSVLKGAVDDLDDNDFGRPWPSPRGDVIARAVADHPADLCLRAARAAREITQAQDRAPNITALFEKKLGEMAEARRLVRKALSPAGSQAA